MLRAFRDVRPGGRAVCEAGGRTMTTPRYVAVKVGDQYVMQRKDASHQTACSTVAALGVAMTLLGFKRRTLPGALIAAGGIMLLSSGATGCNPIASLLRVKRERRAPDDPFGPSIHHEAQATQKPA